MPSNHPRAAALIAAGLYRNLSSFRELEARIAALPEEIVRGDAFEIFVEGYLRTMPVFQCADFWLVGQVPLTSAVPSICPRTLRASTASSARRAGGTSLIRSSLASGGRSWALRTSPHFLG